LKRVDEPTLILFPDASNLTLATGYYDVQKAALLQAGELMDRFCILDVQNMLDPDLNDFDNKTNFDAAIQELRDNVGMNELKFGAAYTPWINASITKDLSYRDISTKLVKNTVPITLKTLTSTLSASDKAAVDAVIDAYDLLLGDAVQLESQVTAHFVAGANIKEIYDTLNDEFKTNATTSPLPVTNTTTKFKKMVDTTYLLADMIDDLLAVGPPTIDTVELRNDINNIATGLALPLQKLSRYDKAMGDIDLVLEDAADLFPRKTGLGPPAPQHLEWTLPATTNAERVANMLALEKEITSIFNIFYSAYTDVLKTMNEYFKNAEQKLIAAYPVYKNIITAVNNSPTKLPPSSAVAGKYAYVDNTRGVWKSPANVSLEAVKSVTYQVEDKEQQSINVDVNSGKSINVIRYFTGKGNLIWGARTLAGNDNEWRYISVRRFFNMVEESVKKSTAWAVFEPNDANTWIKVKGMIDNFLILQWRAGALQGAKPADAFYVKVGLGETMTSLDILEGRMNVEIGMAVVRPAEFIILTFSHKLVES
jgi:transcriptional regulator